MSDYCSCIICRREFPNKGLHTHFSRVHGTDIEKSKYSSGYNGKYHILAARIEVSKCIAETEYNKSPTYCMGCCNILPYTIRNNKFCNHSCSAKHNNANRGPVSQTTKDAMSAAATGKTYKSEKESTCIVCGSVFNILCGPMLNLTKLRCKNCKHKPRRKASTLDKTKLKDYRLLCKFRFSLNTYPDEFDFTLVKEHGWYSATNKGNNVHGVSRDHMVSVRHGFDNNIDPAILAHPANCALMLHGDNVRKYIGNSITYNELLEKIKDWNIKYPPI